MMPEEFDLWRKAVEESNAIKSWDLLIRMVQETRTDVKCVDGKIDQCYDKINEKCDKIEKVIENQENRIIVLEEERKSDEKRRGNRQNFITTIIAASVTAVTSIIIFALSFLLKKP